MLLHPAFDLTTKTWFTDCGAEAATISDLLAKFPPGTQVQDYFPMGREIRSEERGFSINEMRANADLQGSRPRVIGYRLPQPDPKKGSTRAPRSACSAQASPAPRSIGQRRSRSSTDNKYDRNAILDAWLRGDNAGAIAKVHDVPGHLITAMIQVARQRGDPRAVRYNDPRRGIKS